MTDNDKLKIQRFSLEEDIVVPANEFEKKILVGCDYSCHTPRSVKDGCILSDRNWPGINFLFSAIQ